MAHEDDFPFDLESLLASIAEMLKQKGDTQGVAILASSEASIELLERDNWNGGTYSWGLVFVLDLESFHRLDIRGVRNSAENDILTVATKLFLNYENHTLFRVTIVPRVASVEGWRDNAKNYLAKVSSLPGAAPQTEVPITARRRQYSGALVESELPIQPKRRQYGEPSPIEQPAPAPDPTLGSTGKAFNTAAGRKWGNTGILNKPRAEALAVSIPEPAANPASERTAMSETKPMKIFLSHKGIDKPMVQQFYDVLKELGFEPWFDKESMTAGMNLERGILKGMKESCAAVFFATPNFKDEKYIGAEVDHAIAQKRERGDDFTIITLVFHSKDKKGEVPELFRPYVWDAPPSGLEGLRTILKSIPVKVGPVVWGRK